MLLDRVVPRLLGAGAVAGAALTSYALVEARRYTLRRVTVPVLAPGRPSLRVLHLSDLHVTPDQTRKLEWLSSLAVLRPDLVVDTGDNLAHRDAVPAVRDALGPLLDVPGVFVMGSNDYFEPSFRNPFLYLLPDTGKRHTDVAQLPWRELRTTFTDRGWVDLTNTRATVSVGGTTIAFAGVDDPHLEYDRLDEIAGPADRTADLRLGVAHAPYLRVLDQFATDGYDAVLAGHTHGGQVCLPGGRALTTNCDLEPARARGLHRHPAGSRPGDPGSSWLHVSAGLGTSPYARIRVACRPEATLLTLVSRS
ncbi:metallophosphoesterase [Nocardioides lianchengensis]|uniref:Predicted phosphohydrolase, MPP superfamily n=1 Tax=Nocardioides lianchengensis TaxID=1045774 RepID=A0A1G6Q3T1_9ACTN|nr:metallophosphoesterase [Nocardioides lianchengensis]NYG12063.1 putative MPP superfamily phosphohydrolase [Nocardioides lianchengensis]SDC86297.1 Predicted phosphohydrolase, MPP superfamily [Nocardioides lianchengensis]